MRRNSDDLIGSLDRVVEPRPEDPPWSSSAWCGGMGAAGRLLALTRIAAGLRETSSRWDRSLDRAGGHPLGRRGRLLRSLLARPDACLDEDVRRGYLSGPARSGCRADGRCGAFGDLGPTQPRTRRSRGSRARSSPAHRLRDDPASPFTVALTSRSNSRSSVYESRLPHPASASRGLTRSRWPERTGQRQGHHAALTRVVRSGGAQCVNDA